MYQTPIQPDDTQPTSPQASRETIPNRKQQHKAALPTWALMGLIFFSIVSLLATLMLLFTQGTTPENTQSLSIIVIVAGERQELESQASNVGELIQEAGISLSQEDAISPSLETPLSDGLLITIARVRNVSLIINNDERTIRTPFENPADILQQEAIILGDKDKIWLDGTLATHDELALWTVPVSEILIHQAYQLTIMDGTTQTLIESSAPTVGEALYEAGIDIFLTDIVTPPLGESITGNTSININRSRPVTIQVDGVSLESRVQGETVADALSEAGIALLGLDYAIPAENAPIEANMTISVLRVTEEIISIDEPIPYETTYQADPNLELDQVQVIQAGQAGIQRYSERVRYEDGLEIAREPIGTEQIQSPQNQVIAYGTNIILRTVDTPEGVREYWRKLRVYATSYHPEAVGGNTRTAIGETLRFGIIGADPRIIPYRTNVFVPNYGVGMIADTGGPRSSQYWIDLGYSDEDYVGWHQYTDIYLLTPIPANINYLLPEWSPMRGLPDN